MFSALNLLRFAKAEGLVLVIFAALQAAIMFCALPYYFASPHARASYLIDNAFTWQLMAASGACAALLLGGPCYLWLARRPASGKRALWISGSVTALAGLSLFGWLLWDSMSNACG